MLKICSNISDNEVTTKVIEAGALGIILKVNYSGKQLVDKVKYLLDGARSSKGAGKVEIEKVGYFTFGTLKLLSEESRINFEMIPQANKAPEVGSRAMENIIISKDMLGMPWIIVQKNRYRYLTFEEGVRMVFSEYLWCEIIW